MADKYEYLVVSAPETVGSKYQLQGDLQKAADDNYEWVGTVALIDGGDFVVMKRKKPA